jgi:hypothetical protein
MHLFDSKKAILRPKSDLIFKLTPYLTVFYLGPTPEHRHTSPSDALTLNPSGFCNVGVKSRILEKESTA